MEHRSKLQLVCVTIGLVVASLTMACKAGNATQKAVNTVLEVSATVETEPMKTGGDSADDSTLWVNPNDPSLSLIIGTNKQRGLAAYDLSGKEVQFLPDGRMNNVDHRDNFLLGGKKVSLVTASNRSNNSVAIYRVNPETRRLENVAARTIKTVEAYGSCMYHSSSTGKFYYIVTNKRGEVEQLELFDNGKGLVDARRARLFKRNTQLEGCVADDELDQLYIGEEAVGIWKYSALPESTATPTKVDGVMPSGNLKADVEGLTIAYGKDGQGYLIASSQGNNTYVVYRREGNNAYVKTFRIVAGQGIDDVSETDGIYVTTENLGPAFPSGVFIAQDGLDDKGKQNFKLVPW
ncbi:MAG TPA: phytase, partial [Pyrinomonadaceae bacterium]|nr:phytase [Pyrinomonadaceae bacterium]